MTSTFVLPPPVKASKQPHNPISRPQIETIISRSVAVFALLFAAQALPVVMGQFADTDSFWGLLFIIGIYGGIAALIVATFLRRFVFSVNAYISFAYLAALTAWPFVALERSSSASDRPWLWLLCTVATSTAAVAFTRWQATAYLFIAPIMYGIVRVTPSGGGRSADAAALDVTYAIILGGAVLILITILRQAAARVDAAQAAALSRYEHAVRQHATEEERVQVDSIVHDSVLTTFLSAARAYSPQEKMLTTQMAVKVMGHLIDAATVLPNDDSSVTLGDLRDRIVDASSELVMPVELRGAMTTGAMTTGETMTGEIATEHGKVAAGLRGIPLQSADAIYSATVQALINSQQHAGSGGGVRRWLSIDTTFSGDIRVEVGDNGIGFTPELIRAERLGLRISIVERVARAGGAVSVVSANGAGTTIVITWTPPETAGTSETGPRS